MDPSMMVAVYVSLTAWGLIYAYLLMQRLNIAHVEEEIEYLEHVVHTV